MNNAQIARRFEEIATLLELAGENPFRIRAYQRAAQTVSGLSRPLSELPEAERLEIAGIGKGLAAQIVELDRKSVV